MEQSTLITELTQGMELAKQLKLHLNAETSIESREYLVQKILSSYDKALMILNWNGAVFQSLPEKLTAAAAALPESPASIDGSSRSEVFDRGLQNNNQQCKNNGSKKRKMMPRWTEQVNISSENGLEGPQDDGYSWRKYGQKDILGCKYPRSYYRCTYRNIKDCWATKQVQRSDKDPTIFDIMYRGTHTCIDGNHSNPQPATPEPQETKQDNQKHNNDNHESDVLISLKNGLRVNTEEMKNIEMHNYSLTFDGFSQSFISPVESESNYFSVSQGQMGNFGGVQMSQQNEYYFNEIVSADTSVTSSPIPHFDFSLDKIDIDPNFPFGDLSFFTL